jgi:hypothetical protein
MPILLGCNEGRLRLGGHHSFQERAMPNTHKPFEVTYIVYL